LSLAEGPIHNGYLVIIQCGHRHAHIILGFTNWCLVSLALNQSMKHLLHDAILLILDSPI
jgi:hypothetical protein